MAGRGRYLSDGITRRTGLWLVTHAVEISSLMCGVTQGATPGPRCYSYAMLSEGNSFVLCHFHTFPAGNSLNGISCQKLMAHGIMSYCYSGNVNWSEYLAANRSIISLKEHLCNYHPLRSWSAIKHLPYKPAGLVCNKCHGIHLTN